MIGDPNVFIALAAENGAAAQRDSEAWGVVANLARAVSLETTGQDKALAAEFERVAKVDLHKLMTNPLYAAIPPLAETSKHVHQIIMTLVEAV